MSKKLLSIILVVSIVIFALFIRGFYGLYLDNQKLSLELKSLEEKLYSANFERDFYFKTAQTTEQERGKNSANLVDETIGLEISYPLNWRVKSSMGLSSESIVDTQNMQAGRIATKYGYELYTFSSTLKITTPLNKVEDNVFGITNKQYEYYLIPNTDLVRYKEIGTTEWRYSKAVGCSGAVDIELGFNICATYFLRSKNNTLISITLNTENQTEIFESDRIVSTI